MNDKTTLAKYGVNAMIGAGFDKRGELDFFIDWSKVAKLSAQDKVVMKRMIQTISESLGSRILQ